MSLNVKVENTYSGPMDLLLYLVKRDEIDIHDIPVGYLTKEYLSEIKRLELIDVDAGGEFVAMASMLTEIKSRMLIPPAEVEEGEEVEDDYDPRQGLVKALLEYKRFKEVAAELEQMSEMFSQRYGRTDPYIPALPAEISESAQELGVLDLFAAFQKIARKMLNSAAPKEIINEEVATEVRIEQIKDVIAVRDRVSFTSLLSDNPTRDEMVGFFIALLELIRLKVIRAQQSVDFSEIYFFESTKEIEVFQEEASLEIPATNTGRHPLALALIFAGVGRTASAGEKNICNSGFSSIFTLYNKYSAYCKKAGVNVEIAFNAGALFPNFPCVPRSGKLKNIYRMPIESAIIEKDEPECNSPLKHDLSKIEYIAVACRSKKNKIAICSGKVHILFPEIRTKAFSSVSSRAVKDFLAYKKAEVCKKNKFAVSVHEFILKLPARINNRKIAFPKEVICVVEKSQIDVCPKVEEYSANAIKCGSKILLKIDLLPLFKRGNKALKAKRSTYFLGMKIIPCEVINAPKTTKNIGLFPSVVRAKKINKLKKLKGQIVNNVGPNTDLCLCSDNKMSFVGKINNEMNMGSLRKKSETIGQIRDIFWKKEVVVDNKKTVIGAKPLRCITEVFRAKPLVSRKTSAKFFL